MSRALRAALILPAMLAGPGAAAARAEDFTGFYAGVNAGYGFERDHRDVATGPVTLPGGASDRTGPDLPPSARSAADSPAMRATRAPQRR